MIVQHTPVQKYYVFSNDKRWHGMSGSILWWRYNGNGYTSDLDDAGLFTDEDRAKDYPSPKTCTYVPREVAEKKARTVKLLQFSDLPDDLKRAVNS